MSEREMGQFLWEQSPERIFRWQDLEDAERASYAAREAAIRSDEAAKVRAATIEEVAKVADEMVAAAYAFIGAHGIRDVLELDGDMMRAMLRAAIRALGSKDNG